MMDQTGAIRRAAVVTGAAGGIGLATVRRLIAAGQHVLMVDLDAGGLAQMAAEYGDNVSTAVLSVTDGAAVLEAVNAYAAARGRIDVLINVAGGAGPTRAYEIETIGDDVWDYVIELNVKSTFLLCRAVVPHMRRGGYGRIVNLSSTLAEGEKGPPTTVAARLPYATAKAALNGLTAQLAKDLAADGITVNSVLPGLILGGSGTRIRNRFEELPEADKARMVAGYPVGRPGEADEVAATIAFLASESAGYVTGARIPVDGGYL